MDPAPASYTAPQDILVLANDLDDQVREAVEEGRIRLAMKRLGPHIVSRPFFFSNVAN
jgi:hypothetical protein